MLCLALCIGLLLAACGRTGEKPQTAAGDTVCFTKTADSFTMAASGEQITYGQLQERFGWTQTTLFDTVKGLSPEDAALPQNGTLYVGMSQAEMNQALFKNKTEADLPEYPGAMLAYGDEGYIPLTGVYAGVPFRMSLRLTDGSCLQGIQIQFFEASMDAVSPESWLAVRNRLAAQLGEPNSGDTAFSAEPDGILGAGWESEDRRSGVSLTWSEENDHRSLTLLLSGVVGG